MTGNPSTSQSPQPVRERVENGDIAGPMRRGSVTGASSLPNASFRTLGWRVLVPTAFLSAIVLAALLAPWVSPYHFSAQDFSATLSAPTQDHLLGTDHLGRDILSRLIWGSRPTLFIVAGAALFGGIIGISIGLVSGYYSGWKDTVLMRLMDTILGIPGLLLGMVIVGIAGRNPLSLIAAIGMIGVPQFARLARAGALRVRDREFVKAALLSGAKDRYLLFRAILPNIAQELYVQAIVFTATAVLIESTLSFLGLGVSPPTPTWGGMISESKAYLALSPTYGLFAGLILTLVILMIDMLANGLRRSQGSGATDAKVTTAEDR